MKYYRVEAKCGHVHVNHYLLKTFYTCANSKKEAAANVRKAPRVKHNQKDAIKSVIEITYEEYVDGKSQNLSDPYFQVHNSSDQRMMCVDLYLQTSDEIEKIHYKKNYDHKKQKIIEKLIAKEWYSERNYLYE